MTPWKNRIGTLLVALQFGFILLLAWLGLATVWPWRVPAGALALAGVGLALAVWSLWANRPGNFNIRPVPRAGALLVRSGPYRWIRHPMYTSIAACGGACAWAAGGPLGWLALVALLAVLLSKAALEERWMLQVHPEYAAYQLRTHWFLPGIL